MGKLEEFLLGLTPKERDKLLEDGLKTQDSKLVKLAILLGAQDRSLMAETLRFAAREEDESLLHLLIESGLEVENGTLQFLLKKACEADNLKMVKYLISLGADATDVKIAEKAVSGNVLRVLVENGANKKYLFNYVARKGDKELADFCMEKFGDKISEMQDVKEAIVTATIYENEAFAIALYEAGACNDEETLYRVFVNASSHGCKELVDKIIKEHTIPAIYLNYSLVKAAENNCLEIVENLLEAGADPDDDKSFALRKAIVKGNLKVVEILLKAGADLRTNNYEAIKLAAQGYNGIFEYLMSVLEN